MEHVLSLSLNLVDTVLVAVVLGFLLKMERDRNQERALAVRVEPKAPEDAAERARLMRLARIETLANMNLTMQEYRVAQLMADGTSYPEIARKLGISVRTVQHHARQLMIKAKVSSRGEFRTLLDEAGEEMVGGERKRSA